MNEQEECQNWLDNLKEGDVVACNSYYNGFITGNVSRRTKTQILINWSFGGQEMKFNNNGHQINGDKYHPNRLIRPTQEIYDAIQLKKAKDKLFMWFQGNGPSKLAIGQFIKIFAVINNE